MRILSVDSSGKTASAGISEDGRVLYEAYSDTGLTHSRTIVPMIEACLKGCSLRPEDIDLYSAVAGPGSFTGLRIGISAVKAMAWACGKPCAGVSSLESLAWNACGMGKTLCCVTDARAGQIYYGLFFSGDGEEGLSRLTEDTASTVDELSDRLKSQKVPVLLLGDGARVCYNQIKERAPLVVPAPEQLLSRRTYGVSMSALSMARAGGLTDAAGLSPAYLRIPQAERERLKKTGVLIK